MQPSEKQPPTIPKADDPGKPGTPGDSHAGRMPALPGRKGSAWAGPVAWMVTVLILVGGALIVFKSCRDLPGDTLDRATQLAGKVGEKLERVAAAFKKGTITTTFTSYATSMQGSQFFQFATVSQTEIFTQTNESSFAYGYIPLPDVIVEARAPVTYTYYLDFNDKWEFVLQDGALIVIAPDIRFNRPAVDVSKLTWEVKKGSHFRNEGAAMDELKSSITWMAYQKARMNIELVRDTGRRQTELFVANWLAKRFADGAKYPVKVRFRNEPPAGPPRPQGPG